DVSRPGVATGEVLGRLPDLEVVVGRDVGSEARTVELAFVPSIAASTRVVLETVAADAADLAQCVAAVLPLHPAPAVRVLRCVGDEDAVEADAGRLPFQDAGGLHHAMEGELPVDAGPVPGRCEVAFGWAELDTRVRSVRAGHHDPR